MGAVRWGVCVRAREPAPSPARPRRRRRGSRAFTQPVGPDGAVLASRRAPSREDDRRANTYRSLFFFITSWTDFALSAFQDFVYDSICKKKLFSIFEFLRLCQTDSELRQIDFKVFSFYFEKKITYQVVRKQGSKAITSDQMLLDYFYR